MAKAILVANWKNHPDSPLGARALLSALAKKRSLYKSLYLYVAPPLAYFSEAANRLQDFAKLAAQDISKVTRGTHTGVVGVDILKAFGTSLAILGHSERRALGETDREVALKVRIALEAGIAPLVCVGEKMRDAEGEHLEFLRYQLKASLEGVKKENARKIWIAYEPVWAIGKSAKSAVSKESLSENTLFIRKVLSDLFGREAAEKVSILYGGSVEPANARELYEDTGVRGFLVGHASLDAKMFAEIAQELA